VPYATFWDCAVSIFFVVSMSSCFQNSADVERELRAAMDQRRAALERGDADGYSKLTADNLVIVDDDGLYRTKTSVLEQTKRDGPRPPVRNISDLHLQVNGDIGIVAYHVDKEDRIGNQSIKSETRHLDIYKRRSGKWILISRLARQYVAARLEPRR
jgi:ketosteroid isomerase-like protein